MNFKFFKMVLNTKFICNFTTYIRFKSIMFPNQSFETSERLTIQAYITSKIMQSLYRMYNTFSTLPVFLNRNKAYASFYKIVNSLLNTKDCQRNELIINSFYFYRYILLSFLINFKFNFLISFKSFQYIIFLKNSVH